MNSSPMILRLVSGSVTPPRRARKRSSACTATSGTWKVSRNAAITCSPSFLRIRPWSTNTQVSCSPTALHQQGGHRRVDAPGEPADHPLAPHLGPDPLDLLLDHRRGRPAHVAAADVLEEGLEDGGAV